MVLEVMPYLGKSNFYATQIECTPICNNILQIKGYNNVLEKSPVKDVVAFGAKKSKLEQQNDILRISSAKIANEYIARARWHLKFAEDEAEDSFRYGNYRNRALDGEYDGRYTPQQIAEIKRKSKNKANELYEDRIRHIESAISDYSRAIEEDPKNVDAYIERGRIYLNKVNKSNEVLIAAEQNYKLAERSHFIPEVYKQIENAYKTALKRHQKLLTDIVDNYTEVISLDPNNATAYMARGKANYELQKVSPDKDLKRVIVRDLSRAMQLNPKNIQAFTTRAEVAYELYLKNEFDDKIATVIEKDCDNAISLADGKETLALDAYKYRGLLNYERVMTLGEGEEYAQSSIRDLGIYFKYCSQDLDICTKLAELYSVVNDREGIDYFRYCADKIRGSLNQ